MANAFRLEVIGAKDVRAPFKTISSTTFLCILIPLRIMLPILDSVVSSLANLYIVVSKIYVVAVARQNVDAAMAYGLLYRLVEMFTAFFGDKFDEEAIHNNFVLAYELLDGM